MRCLLFICLVSFLLACAPVKKPLIESQYKLIDSSALVGVSSDFSAHWLTPSIILLPNYNNESEYFLSIQDQQVHRLSQLTPTNNEHTLLVNTPHLAKFSVYSVGLDVETIKSWLKGGVSVIEFDKNKIPKHIAKVQTAQLIDYLYTANENDADEITEFGTSISNNSIQIKLWAPTARKIALQLFNEDKSPTNPSQIFMTENSATGVWSARLNKKMMGKYYRYQLEIYHPSTNKIELLTTTDPYSLSLSTNSEYTQIIDLTSDSTKPKGWDKQQVIEIGAPENNVLYETHIRDFSAYDSTLSTLKHRGKYGSLISITSLPFSLIVPISNVGNR